MPIRDILDAPQFENVNALRAYPFADGSSLVDKFGRELPRDVVVDVSLVVPSELDNPESGFSHAEVNSAKLVSAHLSRQMISVCFLSTCSGSVCAMSVSVSRNSFRPYFPYRLDRLSGSEDCGGIVTFGDFEFPENPETYFFETAHVHPCCCASVRPSRLRRFVDMRSGESVEGDVEIAFSGHVIAEKDGSSVRLSLESGSEKELASSCAFAAENDICGATPIMSINGIRPDRDGNIVILFH